MLVDITKWKFSYNFLSISRIGVYMPAVCNCCREQDSENDILQPSWVIFSWIHNRSNYSDEIWHRSLYYCHKRCAFGFIFNYLEKQHIQYGARQPSWIPKIKIVYIVVLLKVDCLPDAVGKQPTIPLINLERKWTLNWWWWWWCEYSNFSHHHTNIPTHQLNWNVIWLYISLYLAYRRVELHMPILDLG